MNIMVISSTSLHTGNDLAVSIDIEFLVIKLHLLSPELRKQYGISHLHHSRDDLTIVIMISGSCLEHHSVAGRVRFVYDDA